MPISRALCNRYTLITGKNFRLPRRSRIPRIDWNSSNTLIRPAKDSLLLCHLFLQFDALRKQLKMKAGYVTMRFRELGATATPVKASEDAATGQERQYHVVLLPKVRFWPHLVRLVRKGKTTWCCCSRFASGHFGWIGQERQCRLAMFAPIRQERQYHVALLPKVCLWPFQLVWSGKAISFCFVGSDQSGDAK